MSHSLTHGGGQVPHDVPEVPGFEDLRLIGAGGFSSVWAATEILFGRSVALKVIDSANGQRRRLDREAKALGQLSGLPHVIQPYSVTSTSDGRLALVLPLLDSSLAERIEIEGPLAGTEVVRWATALAGALDVAHNRGVYHRDIKPENVLFGDAGEAFLADFGIASVEGMAAATVTAMSLSPLHAPPERFGADECDPAAGDRWSFASTVFTAICGSPPFGSISEGGFVGLLNRICRDNFWHPPDLPVGALTVFERGLAKNPDRRFGSACEFVEALTQAVGSPSAVPAAEPTPQVPVGLPDQMRASDPTILRDHGWPTSPSSNEVAETPPQRGQLDLEYDCTEWTEELRRLLAQSVTNAGIEHNWDGPALSVGLWDEGVVDGLIANIVAHVAPGEPLGAVSVVEQMQVVCSSLERLRFEPEAILSLVDLSDQIVALQPPVWVRADDWSSILSATGRLRDALEHDDMESPLTDIGIATLAGTLRRLLLHLSVT